MGLAVATLVLAVAFGTALSAWAHYARQYRGLAIALYVAFGGLAVLLGLIGLEIVARAPLNLNGLSISRGTGYTLIAVALGLGLPLLPPVRYLLSQVTPLDRSSITDAAGLSVILAFVLANLGAGLVAGNAAFGSVSEGSIVIQDAMFVVLAFIAVGTFMTRSFRCSVERLGLVRPTGRQFLTALGLVVVAFSISILAALLMHFLQPGLEQEITQRMKTLTGSFQSIRGAIVLGTSAGIGEEILFRGALQPRYGVVLTSLLFAMVHVQYGFSLDVLAVFLVGIVLGIERKRLNTTSSVITHAVYDILALLLGTG